MNTNGQKKYLVVDLDNSLLKIDLFKEVFGKSLLTQPLAFIKTLLLLFKSKALAKTYISNNVNIDSVILPFENRIIEIISNYKKKNYDVTLATGASHNYANAISNHIKLFDRVIATNKEINNIGENKLQAIKNEIGDNFIYIGDSSEDIPIWSHCKKAIIVGHKPRIKKELNRNDIEIIDVIKNKKSKVKIILNQLRIHQWSKNILLFVPAFASHQLFNASVFTNIIIGFISFSLFASSIYIVNDIVDIDNDRAHPKNKKRPISAGNLPIFQAYFLLFTCLIFGVCFASILGSVFFIIMISYVFLNFLYSFFCKRIIILDVIFLMIFYILRLIAGHAPDKIPLSPWLLAFCMFLFFSLGFLKRYVDTIIIRKNNSLLLKGRGYSIHDGKILVSLGVGSGLLSSLVLILYTTSNQVQGHYSSPLILICLAPLMLYWISRIWLMAERGKIKGDPVLFTIKDLNSYVVAFCGLIVIITAFYYPF
ncbi:MAG: hypothetical protein CMA12_07985 [Euryarchaeota archaeon]|nr:hypothetical protein [Euryarchaeota archaeon]|tara:strand:- start:8734 stop:10176 length:1443 start_codon:yes stop_codon:yes gene_type:complete